MFGSVPSHAGIYSQWCSQNPTLVDMVKHYVPVAGKTIQIVFNDNVRLLYTYRDDI